MTDNLDWDVVFENRYATAEAPNWWSNKYLRPISIKGLSLFAIDPKTNEIFWNGHQLQTVKRLDDPERIMAGIATGSAAIVALLELIRFVAAFA
ncbi:hypothetical protein SIAM614_25087 [Roseibium aggregatum IAM 12614]|uniref:Uncharacterized protein n=1 Tax=Roseibium aggregatum (strain ATCC 25650 / DSM 13394 / JCM 20685 / NBRC 16684 / NCIMB 2208 / IAM 12614 / B1) TaxID=384765 RepID=A0NYV4_ROSAI|nr:hypothetical protein [Roseibium aggregatum]EAV41955.1 hypothetical protein SIAM614_25087 [Roseibium aggregatum IAM 12614]